ncbi:hypothetical protein QBC34DRAFT_415067 [Podospora aff. communis PSN243]|uniref:Coiled-coil domain-containing protein 16 n=1 Tax=Podospora aff. communis PSN243 TaxID=3040156 RepID=A0AAV9GB28_9PEZI|nr:hypothetical protein QBC34DRAFT_415067 [Podospora aff. communis PSN243]
MADVRALLRQQREARRIEHPHAAYSDAGKLLCVVCHEHIKTETLWDGHVRGMGHRQRLHTLQQRQETAQVSSTANGHGDDRASNGTQSHKRKLDDDEEMAEDVAEEEAVRRKRSKPDMTLADQENKENVKAIDGKPSTPPLTRRQSGAPALGVEMRIPSRPATPVALREGSTGTNSLSGMSTATTPKTAPVGRSPLIPQEGTVAQLPQRTDTAAKATPGAASLEISTAPIDDVWAAFEADLVHGTSGTNAKPPAVAGFANSDAVISAPAMSAADLAAKAEEEDQEKRKTLAEIQIEDEREDATRALENEFEIMEELEARAKKLRERREAIRRQSHSEGTSSGTAAPAVAEKAPALGKENAVIEEEEDDDDEDEMDDDWVGFRFRG